jgi:DNA-binding transcriptional LysR family regulator
LSAGEPEWAKWFVIQVPRYHIESDLESGTLVTVLPDYPPSPTPVSLLYPRNRQLSPRVRVFIDWLVRAFDAKSKLMLRARSSRPFSGP